MMVLCFFPKRRVIIPSCSFVLLWGVYLSCVIIATNAFLSPWRQQPIRRAVFDDKSCVGRGGVITTRTRAAKENSDYDDLGALTVSELKAVLKSKSLPVSGRKNDLIERLLENNDFIDTNDEPQQEQDVEESSSYPASSTDEKPENSEVNERIEETEDEGSNTITATTADLGPKRTKGTVSELYKDKVVKTKASTFESLGLCQEALNAVKSQRSWKRPTPCQQLAIPELVRNTNEHQSFLCEAPTGSGKTAAYALPLLQQLLLRHRKKYGDGNRRDEKKNRRNKDDWDDSMDQNVGKIDSLVLCPTRELAVQIGNVFRSLSSHMIKSRDNPGWRIYVIHGGVPLEPQISSLARCVDEGLTVDVLVATPGRLVDVLTHYQNDDDDDDDDDNASANKDAAEAAFEKRLLESLDSKGKTDVSLSLEEIQDLELDRIDDDGRGDLAQLLKVDTLVLDEADRLLGRAFGSEMNNVLDLLLSSENAEERKMIQTWLFSATFPKQIEPRIDSVLKRLCRGESAEMKPPVRIACAQLDRVLESQQEASETLKKRLQRTALGGESTISNGNANRNNRKLAIGPASTIKLRTIRLEKPDRTQALRRLLESPAGTKFLDRVLVFVATRYASEHVARKLRRVGISASELHGKLDQDARQRRLSDFAKGKIRVLLATDVAARGLDVVGLPAVINYDLPRSTADFVHRVGRTGRAGKLGTAITFLTANDEEHLDLIEKRHLQHPVEREILPGFEPDEEKWAIQSSASRTGAPGTTHSTRGLAHDRMHGGIKGRRKSKKDRLREEAARQAAEKRSQTA